MARVNHHAAVPYAEVPALIAELRQREGIAVKALQCLILTAARTGEVLRATWEEVDLDGATWTVPAERMKSGKEHRVPLSPPTVALLRSLYREGDNPHLFIGLRNERLSHAALSTTGVVGRTETVHGMCSAFSDWAHERTSHANHTIELSLADSVGGAVEKAYRRGDLFDKRRKLMEALGAVLHEPTREGRRRCVTLMTLPLGWKRPGPIPPVEVGRGRLTKTFPASIGGEVKMLIEVLRGERPFSPYGARDESACRTETPRSSLRID